MAHYNSNSSKLKKIKNPKLELFKLNFLEPIEEIERVIKFLQYEKIDSFVNLTGHIDNDTFYNFSVNNLINTLKVNTIILIYCSKNNI